MEFVAQAQALIAENAMYVGIGLLFTLILAGFLWYSMSRGSSGSGSKAVLENQARMNMANTDVPAESSMPDPVQPQISQEELEKQIANIGNMESNNAQDE